MNGLMDEWMDEWIDGCRDGWIQGWMDAYEWNGCEWMEVARVKMDGKQTRF